MTLPWASVSRQQMSWTPRTRRGGVPKAIEAAEIPFDIHFLRSAKSALQCALAEEDGVLDDDAKATVDALALANPTDPDPSSDVDLWSGDFTLATSTLSFDGGLVTQRGAASVSVDEHGELSLDATLVLGQPVAPASLSLVGRLRAVGNDQLELMSARLTVSCSAEATIIAACGETVGLTFQRGTRDSEWIVEPTLPPLRLHQRYLDQDCHILQLDEHLAGQSPTVVLFKRSTEPQ